MRILVEPLRTTTLVYQGNATDRILVRAIRPRMYKVGSPPGTITMTVKQSGDVMGAASLTLAQIEAGVGSSLNFHGFIKYLFTNDLVINKGDFTVEMTSSGYTFAEGSYFGWIIDHEDFKNDNDSVPDNFTDLPLSLEIWEMKRV